MASILQTDVLELYNTWGERVAFNEGYQVQKIAEAKQAGRDAFHLGIDRSQGQGLYFEAKDQRFSEAKEFLSSEPAAQISDESISDVEPESIEPDQIGDVSDGEETLGMESVVVNVTEWNFPEMSLEREAYWADISAAYTLRPLDEDFGEYGAMSFEQADDDYHHIC